METFLFDFSPKFVIFLQIRIKIILNKILLKQSNLNRQILKNIFILDRIFKPNNEPKNKEKGKTRSPVLVTNTTNPGISGKRLLYIVKLSKNSRKILYNYAF